MHFAVRHGKHSHKVHANCKDVIPQAQQLLQGRATGHQAQNAWVGNQRIERHALLAEGVGDRWIRLPAANAMHPYVGTANQPNPNQTKPNQSATHNGAHGQVGVVGGHRPP